MDTAGRQKTSPRPATLWVWCLSGGAITKQRLCGRRANWREEGFGQEPYNMNVRAP